MTSLPSAVGVLPFPAAQYLLDPRLYTLAGLVAVDTSAEQRVIVSFLVSHMGDHR